MNKYLSAIALTIALPAAAFAQAAPAPAPKMECCEKMKDCCCCKEMAGKGHDQHGEKAGGDPHAGHDKPAGHQH